MSSRLYRALCGAGDAFVAKSFPKGPINTIWHHEAGPKTIFFWAPFWKWTIVIAGIADLARPAHRTVTMFQACILFLTGLSEVSSGHKIRMSL